MLVFFACCFQVSRSTGYFELQMISVENVNGELADGECCDGSRNSEDLRCTRDECDTYFRVCLKEYQMEVIYTGTCIFGSGSTQVLGGNTFSLKGTKNNPNKIDEAGKILISFQFAWPVSGDVFTPFLRSVRGTLRHVFLHSGGSFLTDLPVGVRPAHLNKHVHARLSCCLCSCFI